jgi:hypothetical protein
MSLRELIEWLRSEVDAVRPYDRARLPINCDRSEISRFVEGREDTCPQFGREIRIPCRAIAEQQAEHAVTNHGYTDHDWQIVLAHAFNTTWLMQNSAASAANRIQPVTRDRRPADNRGTGLTRRQLILTSGRFSMIPGR